MVIKEELTAKLVGKKWQRRFPRKFTDRNSIATSTKSKTLRCWQHGPLSMLSLLARYCCRIKSCPTNLRAPSARTGAAWISKDRRCEAGWDRPRSKNRFATARSASGGFSLSGKPASDCGPRGISQCPPQTGRRWASSRWPAGGRIRTGEENCQRGVTHPHWREFQAGCVVPTDFTCEVFAHMKQLGGNMKCSELRGVGHGANAIACQYTGDDRARAYIAEYASERPEDRRHLGLAL
jgi:hypothetical protein